MKNTIKLIAPLALAVSTSVQADFIGGTIEASYWYGGLGGDASASGVTVDMEDDLNFDDESFFEIAASFEHPVPVIPNVKARLTSLEQDSNGRIDGDAFVSESGPVTSELDLTHYDVIAYYEVLDNWVSIDVGLDVKIFDGEFTVDDGDGDNYSEVIDEFLPLPYAKAEIELPFTGMAFGAELAGLSYSGNGIFDARARIRQNISLAFIELGYRTMSLKIEDIGSDDIEVDVDFSGVYVSTGLDF